MQVMNSNFLQVPLCDLTDYDFGFKSKINHLSESKKATINLQIHLQNSSLDRCVLGFFPSCFIPNPKNAIIK